MFFFWLCYIPFVVAYIYLFLSNLRFLCAVFICCCNFFLSLLVFSLSMLRIIHLVPYFIRGGVLRSACSTFDMLAISGVDIISCRDHFV